MQLVAFEALMSIAPTTRELGSCALPTADREEGWPRPLPSKPLLGTQEHRRPAQEGCARETPIASGLRSPDVPSARNRRQLLPALACYEVALGCPPPSPTLWPERSQFPELETTIHHGLQRCRYCTVLLA